MRVFRSRDVALYSVDVGSSRWKYIYKSIKGFGLGLNVVVTIRININAFNPCELYYK